MGDVRPEHGGAHDDQGQPPGRAPTVPPPRAHVITASNRASAGVYEDRSGQALAAGLAELGFTVSGPEVLPDDVAVLTAALGAAVDSGAEVIVTTGGTGLSPTDITPEATEPVLDRQVPGLAEALRRYGQDQTPYAVLSRGLVGTAGRSLVVNLPGSTGGVRDGLAVLGPLLGHIVSQLRGGDHQP
ncbi:MAG: MogA/MoaB family molybdenum cofactor biosynthesis protein [Geodermatophilaceae bacterium]